MSNVDGKISLSHIKTIGLNTKTEVLIIKIQ